MIEKMQILTSLAFIAGLMTISPSIAFQTGQGSPLSPRTSSSSLTYSTWDAFEMPDNLELMMGGTRYEMVELPDSMMSTTLWVGNLCEFVTDDMLGEIFQQAVSLKCVPACVARKPNMESLRYGFVTFRSEEEKEVSRTFSYVLFVSFFRNHPSPHILCPLHQSLDCYELASWLRTKWQMYKGGGHQRS